MITSELNKKRPALNIPNEEDEGPADAPRDSQYDFGDDTEVDTDDEHEDETKPNGSISTMNDEQSVGKTLAHEEYEEITKRNSEQSPLLRLPAKLRNQIYQYTLSGYIIQPYTRGPKGSKKRETLTYCEPAPGTTDMRPEDNLWLLVQSLSRSSR